MASINHDLHTFQGTLYFLQDQGIEVPRVALRYKGLKKPQTLPRFLTDKQVVALRDDLTQRRDEAKTNVQERNSRLDLACLSLRLRDQSSIGLKPNLLGPALANGNAGE